MSEYTGTQLVQLEDAKMCITDTLANLLRAGYPSHIVSEALRHIIAHPEEVTRRLDK